MYFKWADQAVNPDLLGKSLYFITCVCDGATALQLKCEIVSKRRSTNGTHCFIIEMMISTQKFAG
jgi:hypothetical protein